MIQIKNKQTNKQKIQTHNSTSNTELRAPEEKMYSVEIAKVTAKPLKTKV